MKEILINTALVVALALVIWIFFWLYFPEHPPRGAALVGLVAVAAVLVLPARWWWSARQAKAAEAGESSPSSSAAGKKGKEKAHGRKG